MKPIVSGELSALGPNVAQYVRGIVLNGFSIMDWDTQWFGHWGDKWLSNWVELAKHTKLVSGLLDLLFRSGA